MGRLLLLGTRQAAVTEANDPPGPPSEFDPRGLLPEPPRFDVGNVIVGAVVTCLLVAALGYGTILLSQAMVPPDEGANIGAAILASFGMLIAIALGAAFTAWRGNAAEASRCGKALPQPGSTA
jgi:hypothetical protein